MVVSQTTSITPANHADSHRHGGTDPLTGDVRVDVLHPEGSPIYISPLGTYDVVQGTWAVTLNDFAVNLTHVSNGASTALNDEIRFRKVWVPAGTYSLAFEGRKGGTCGIASILLDTTVIATVDQYAAAHANHITTVTDITVATSGEYDIGIKVTSKNGASSDYLLRIAGIYMSRTA